MSSATTFVPATSAATPGRPPGVRRLALGSDWRGEVPDFVLYPACDLLVLYALGTYRRDAIVDMAKCVRRLPLVVAVGVCCAALASTGVSWVWPAAWLGAGPSAGSFAASGLACFLACALLARALVLLLRRHRIFRPRLLVLGAGRRAWDLMWIIAREGRSLDYDITFAHDPSLGDVDPRLSDNSTHRLVVMGGQGLLTIARRIGASEIVVAPDERRGMSVDSLLACKTAGFPVTQYLSFVEREILRVDLKRIEVGWLLFSEGFHHGLVDRTVKRALDVVFAALLLALLSPALLAAAIAIVCDDGGPILYRQERVTRGSRTFNILKLRTMGVDAERRGAVWAAAKDARITRIGRFLRRTRLDELPQLVNILCGDMSLVGPRPERPGFVDMLSRQIPLYNERHIVKAGLTGWAQVNYPYGASIDDARSKLSFDLYYVKNFSLLLDLRIMLQTLRVVLWPGNGVR